jgi:alanine dehydrogenase
VLVGRSTYQRTKGLFTVNEIYATLAEVVVGKKKGRIDNKVITLFDSTGLAIEDLAVAKLIYEKAQEVGSYPVVDLVDI